MTSSIAPLPRLTRGKGLDVLPGMICFCWVLIYASRSSSRRPSLCSTVRITSVGYDAMVVTLLIRISWLNSSSPAFCSKASARSSFHWSDRLGELGRQLMITCVLVIF